MLLAKCAEIVIEGFRPGLAQSYKADDAAISRLVAGKAVVLP
jgi:hypothetical protein